MNVEMSRSRAATLLVLAAKKAGTLVALGDLPGHEFHGNQWTGGGGGSQTVYHGTISGSLGSIRQRGLLTRHSGKHYAELSKTDSVYVTTDKDTAARYALEAAIRFNMEGRPGTRDVKPVVLEVQIPSRHQSDVIADKDEVGPAGTGFRFKANVPSSWIKRIARVTDDPYQYERHHELTITEFKRLERGDLVVYVPFLAEDDADLRTLGDLPGHEFHGNQWTGAFNSLVERISAPDSGFTYSMVTGHEPKTGYVLSIHKDREQALPLDKVTLDTLIDYTQKNADLLTKPENYLGAWHDPESHKVFLDVSSVTQDAQEAAKLAKEFQQLAYFDLGTMSSVPVTPHEEIRRHLASYRFLGGTHSHADAGRFDPAVYEIEGASTLGRRDHTRARALACIAEGYLRGLGGAGSGNFGHSGRPGEVGGSVGEGFASAPMSKAGGAQWRKRMQDRYDHDPEFKAAADAVTLLTQGSTDLIRAASVAAAGQEKTLLRDYYKKSLDKPMSAAANPMMSYKNFFKGQDVEHADHATLREAGAALNKAIDTSPVLDIPIFRGMPVQRTMTLEPGQQVDPVSGHIVITDEKAYEEHRKKAWNTQEDSWKVVTHPFLKQIDSLKKGDTFSMPGVTSFTSDQFTAKEFSRGEARGQGGRGGDSVRLRNFSAVTMEVQGARGLPVAALSPWNQQEILSRGEFVVEAVTKTPYGRVHDYRIVLRPKR